MRRTLPTLGACCLLVLLGSQPADAAGPGQTPPSPPRAQAASPAAAAAVRTLERAGVFALGGVGFAGTTSETEKALRAVLARKDGPAALRSLLRGRTTVEGRLYALLGLRWADPAAYRKAVGEFRARKGTVRTMRGCVQSDRPVAEVVREIEKGEYDGFKDAPVRDLPSGSGSAA